MMLYDVFLTAKDREGKEREVPNSNPHIAADMRACLHTAAEMLPDFWGEITSVRIVKREE